jgi:hypothetical protein
MAWLRLGLLSGKNVSEIGDTPVKIQEEELKESW